MKQKNTRAQDRRALTRAVAIGLAAGATALPFGVASAAETTTTDTTTSKTIVANDTNDFQSVTLNSSSDYSEIRSTGASGVEVKLTDGMTDHGTTLFATDEDGTEGGWIGVGFGTDIANNYVPSTTASADMTNTTFYAGNGADIELVNGTVITTADKLFGEATDEANGGYGTAAANPGQISIGLDVDGANDLDKIAYANINAKATLKLVDDKTFNDPSSWTYKDSSGAEQTATANNYIKLTDKGVLETDAVQLFGDSITDNTTTTSTEWKNANAAIDFDAGTVLFDDTDLTLAELDAAQSLITAADSGTTLVETKTDTSSMSHAFSKSSTTTQSGVPEHGAFVKATDTSATAISIDNTSPSSNTPDSTTSAFNASSIELAAASGTAKNSVAIVGSTVQLGVKDGQLLTVPNGTESDEPAQIADVTVTDGGALKLVGDSTNTLRANVTLNTNSATTITGTPSFVVTGGDKTVVGEIVANEGTAIEVKDGATLRSGTITAEDNSTVTLGRNTTLKADNLVLNGDTKGDTDTQGTTLNVRGTLSSQRITTSNGDNTINVGASDAKGTLIVADSDKSKLTGATIFLDPIWKTTDEGTDVISDASAFLSDGTTSDQSTDSSLDIDYTLTIGRNSVASLGTTDTTAAAKSFASTLQTWGDGASEVSAALLLEQPISIDQTKGGIVVNGTLTSAPSVTANSVTLAQNSLLMVDVADYDTTTIDSTGAVTTAGTSAITSQAGTLTVNADDTTDSTGATTATGAKLYLEDVKTGTNTYLIASDFSNTNSSGWYDTDDVYTNNRLFKASATNSDSNGNYTVTMTNQKLADVLPGAVLNNNVDGISSLSGDDAIIISTSSTNPGVRYLANATATTTSVADGTYLLNLAAQPAEAAGASVTALNNTQLLAQLAQEHFSIRNAVPDKDGDHIWARYTHENLSVDGLDLAGAGMKADYDSHMNAFTLGYDFPSAQNLRHGLAVSYGTGSTDATNEDDDYDIFGASYYGSIAGKGAGLPQTLFDVGYYTTSHDIDGLIDVEPDTHAFTLGATEEWRFPHGNTAIIPHVGLRYTYLDTPSYDGTYDGGTAFHYAPSSASVLTLPIGVGVARTDVRGNWRYRFSGDLSYIPTLSGRDNDMDVSVAGYNFTDNVSYDLADANQVLLRLGYAGESDRHNWNVSAAWHGGGDSDGYTLAAQYGWKF